MSPGVFTAKLSKYRVFIITLFSVTFIVLKHKSKKTILLTMIHSYLYKSMTSQNTKEYKTLPLSSFDRGRAFSFSLCND